MVWKKSHFDGGSENCAKPVDGVQCLNGSILPPLGPYFTRDTVPLQDGSTPPGLHVEPGKDVAGCGG